MSDASLGDRVRIPERVQYRNVGDHIAIVDLDTGAYFGLDEVGARMWTLMADLGALRSVLARLEEEYEATPEQLRADLLRLVERLRAEGLIEIERARG